MGNTTSVPKTDETTSLLIDRGGEGNYGAQNTETVELTEEQQNEMVRALKKHLSKLYIYVIYTAYSLCIAVAIACGIFAIYDSETGIVSTWLILLSFVVILLSTCSASAIGVITEWKVKTAPQMREEVQTKVVAGLEKENAQLSETTEAIQKDVDILKESNAFIKTSIGKITEENTRLEQTQIKLAEITNDFKDVVSYCGDLSQKTSNINTVSKHIRQEYELVKELKKVKSKMYIYKMFYENRSDIHGDKIASRKKRHRISIDKGLGANKSFVNLQRTMDTTEWDTFLSRLKGMGKVYTLFMETRFKEIAGEDEQIDVREFETKLEEIMKAADYPELGK